MTVEEFNDYWDSEYPGVPPLGPELRQAYPERWFRIHSLPRGKRYAETDEEYRLLLSRQNQLMNDLMAEGTEILIIRILYIGESIEPSGYTQVRVIDLHKIRPKTYERETFLSVFIQASHWTSHRHDSLLRTIADDEIRAVFACPSRRCLVVPYDGGADVIVEGQEKRNHLKAKYRKWLSRREDGR